MPLRCSLYILFTFNNFISHPQPERTQRFLSRAVKCNNLLLKLTFSPHIFFLQSLKGSQNSQEILLRCKTVTQKKDGYQEVMAEIPAPQELSHFLPLIVVGFAFYLLGFTFYFYLHVRQSELGRWTMY